MNSRRIHAMRSMDTPAGVANAHQLLSVSSGAPASFVVGTSGKDFMRVDAVTASALSFPESIKDLPTESDAKY